MDTLVLDKISSYQIGIDPNNIFGIFLTYLFLFLVGGFIGWISEVFFRRIFSMHRWINPGFLKGPCLPLYGFGVCALHLICDICFKFILSPSDFAATNIYYQLQGYDNTGAEMIITPSGALPFWAVSLIVIVTVIIVMTIIEFVAGLIFIKGFKIKLWDYSNLKGNIMGMICPLFSMIWGVCGAIYWFVFGPLVNKLVHFMIPHLWGVTFVLGVLIAVFVIDCVSSVKLSVKVSGLARKENRLVDFEKFKLNLKSKKIKDDRLENFKEQLKLSFTPLTDKLSKVANKVKAQMYIDNKIPEKGSAESDETPRTKANSNKNEDINKKGGK